MTTDIILTDTFNNRKISTHRSALMLGIFGQEPDSCGTHEMLVEIRDGKIYHAETGDRCKIVGEAEIKGWGELVNGPAYRVNYGSLEIALIPQREWNRIMATGEQ